MSCGNHAGHIRNIYISLYIYIDIYSLIEGSLEVKLPTIWTDEKQRWEESEKRGEEERRSKKRKSQKKEDPGARKGRKVAKHRVFPMICGSGGSRSRLAKASGCGASWPDERWKLHAVGRCDGAKHISKSKCTKHLSVGPLLEVELPKKSARPCGAKHISKSKCAKHMFGPLLGVQMPFRVASARDWAPFQKRAKREGFVTFPKTMAGVGHLKRIWQDAFAWQAQYKRHVHQRCCDVRALISWEGLHFGASNLQFWEDDFARQVQHFVWPGITLSWQAQYFRQVEWKKSENALVEAVSSALNFPFLKEVSENCFVFDVVNFEKWGSLAELFRFWRCQVQNWRSLADLFRFWRCQVQKLRKSRRIASFSSLQTDRQTDR